MSVYLPDINDEQSNLLLSPFDKTTTCIFIGLNSISFSNPRFRRNVLLRRSSSLRLKITYSAWFRNVHKDGEKKGSGAQKFRAALQGERIIFEFETWWGSYKKGIFAHYSQSDVSTDSLTRRLDENLPCFWFDNNLDGSSTGPFFFIQCHQGFLIIHVLDCLKAPVKRWNRQNHNGGFVGEFSGSFFSPQCKR